jgi:hypothetical protein
MIQPPHELKLRTLKQLFYHYMSLNKLEQLRIVISTGLFLYLRLYRIFADVEEREREETKRSLFYDTITS